jgi:hypothetical protein
MLMTMLLILILLFSSDVSTDPLGHSSALNASSLAVASTLGEKHSLENTIGVITLNNKSHTKTRRLQFFNEDGSLWYEFSFYDDAADHSFDRAKTVFHPFSFHRDYFVLALKCVGKEANRFQVVVNESTRLTKFIRRPDDSFKFQTWKEHILERFAVGFDPANNPLRTGPGENVRTLRLPSEAVTFHPLQIKGNWLKVSWNVSDDSKGKDKRVEYGWVKWKQNSELLIEFFYFS